MEKTYTLSLSASQVSYIGFVLGKCQYTEVSQIIAGIQTQISAQDATIEVPPAPSEVVRPE